MPAVRYCQAWSGSTALYQKQLIWLLADRSLETCKQQLREASSQNSMKWIPRSSPGDTAGNTPKNDVFVKQFSWSLSSASDVVCGESSVRSHATGDTRCNRTLGDLLWSNLFQNRWHKCAWARSRVECLLSGPIVFVTAHCAPAKSTWHYTVHCTNFGMSTGHVVICYIYRAFLTHPRHAKPICHTACSGCWHQMYSSLYWCTVYRYHKSVTITTSPLAHAVQLKCVVQDYNPKRMIGTLRSCQMWFTLLNLMSWHQIQMRFFRSWRAS